MDRALSDLLAWMLLMAGQSLMRHRPTLGNGGAKEMEAFLTKVHLTWDSLARVLGLQNPQAAVPTVK